MARGGSLTGATGAFLPLGGELFRSLSGVLIVAEMVFGGLVWILVASTNLVGTDLSQGWVMFVSVTFFVFTVIQFVLYILSVPTQTPGWISLNAWFNLAAFILYLSAAVLQANVTACARRQCWLQYGGQSTTTTTVLSTVPTMAPSLSSSLSMSSSPVSMSSSPVTGTAVPTTSLPPVSSLNTQSPTASHSLVSSFTASTAPSSSGSSIIAPSTVTVSTPASASASTLNRRRRDVAEASHVGFPDAERIRLLIIRSVRKAAAASVRADSSSSTTATTTNATSSAMTTKSPTDNNTYRINVAATVFSYLTTLCYAINAYVGMGMWKDTSG